MKRFLSRLPMLPSVGVLLFSFLCVRALVQGKIRVSHSRDLYDEAVYTLQDDPAHFWALWVLFFALFVGSLCWFWVKYPIASSNS